MMYLSTHTDQIRFHWTHQRGNEGGWDFLCHKVIPVDRGKKRVPLQLVLKGDAKKVTSPKK